MKKLLKRFDILFAILLFLGAIFAEYREWFSTTENFFLSARHSLRFELGDPSSTSFPNDKIVIVAQDEAYLEDYGVYPPKWADYAKIIDNISFLGGKVIMVDFLFEFPSSYGEDPILAKSLKDAKNTVMVATLDFESIGSTKLNKIRYPAKTLNKYTSVGYTNLTKLGDKANRVRLYPEINEKLNIWPVCVKVAADYLGVQPKIEGNYLMLGDIKIKLDQFNDFRIDFPFVPMDQYYLYKNPFVGLSGMDILELDRDDEDEVAEYKTLIKDKIVYLGETSEIAHDMQNTIIGEVWGVEMLAMETATLLKGAPLQSASLTAEIILLLIFLFVLILANLLPEPKYRILASAGLFLVYLAFCASAYIYIDVVFSISYVFFAGIIGFAVINIYLFVLERKEKSYIKNAFGQYLSPKVIEDLVNDPSKLSLGGERREMTAFFSDVQGFSTISESLTPDELVHLLNNYLTEMCTIIAEHNGTIDKFEGDAIIAFWGAPLDQPDHATLACLACIDMQKRLVELRKTWVQEGRPQLLVRMGVNSGPMVVGNMGSQSRMDYTMMGDAVNLAARLEGANKFYKNFTMISEFTYKQASDVLDCRELDTIRVVGKNEPITVYEVLDRKNKVTGKMAEMVETFNKGLDLYKQMNFKDAITIFESALSLVPMDGPSKTYVARCQEFLENPPGGDDWDRVYTHTEKG